MLNFKGEKILVKELLQHLNSKKHSFPKISAWAVLSQFQPGVLMKAQNLSIKRA